MTTLLRMTQFKLKFYSHAIEKCKEKRTWISTKIMDASSKSRKLSISWGFKTVKKFGNFEKYTDTVRWVNQQQMKHMSWDSTGYQQELTDCCKNNSEDKNYSGWSLKWKCEIIYCTSAFPRQRYYFYLNSFLPRS